MNNQVEFATLAALGRVVRETAEDVQRRKLSSLDLKPSLDAKPIARALLVQQLLHETSVHIFLSPDQSRITVTGLDASSICAFRLEQCVELASLIRILNHDDTVLLWTSSFPPLKLKVKDDKLWCFRFMSFGSVLVVQRGRGVWLSVARVSARVHSSAKD